MTIPVTLLHVALLFWASYTLWKKQTVLREFFWPALALKMLAGVALGLVYTYYYSVADTFVYFRDASTVAALARRDFGAYVTFLFSDSGSITLPLTFQEPRALLLTRITSVFNLLTDDNYWVTGFYYSLVSFSAAWFLVTTICRHIPTAKSATLIAFLFLPSAVFWSSGLLKESLALACLYFLTGIFLKVWFRERGRPWEYVVAFLSLLVFWKLKYYYAGVFLPVAVTALLFRFMIGKRCSSSPALEALVWCLIFIIPVAVVSFLHPNFYPDRLLNVVLLNHEAYRAVSAPEDLVVFRDLQANAVSFLKNAPWALFSGLFRPLPWEVSALIQVLPSLENTLMLGMSLAAASRYRRYALSPHRLLLLAAVTYVVILCVMITFSTPNFGTLSRYKTAYISFFVLVILSDNPLLKYIERSFHRLVSH